MIETSSDPFVRSHLKIRHLVLLVELGRCASVVTAAAAAHMTQSAASKLLAELEQGLGVQLFERLPRGVRATTCGQVLIRRAGAALAEMKAGYDEVRELATGVRGKVALGSIQTPSVGLLPRAIALLEQRAPGARVTLDVAASRTLVDGLRMGTYDIVVGRMPDADQQSDVQFEVISEEPHVLVTGARHALAGRERVTLAELAEQAWILPPAGSVLGERLMSMFLAQGLAPPAASVSTAQLPLVLALLQGDRMIAALPLALLRCVADGHALAVLPFDLHLPTDVYGIITRRNRQLSPVGAAMLAALREAAGSARASPDRA